MSISAISSSNALNQADIPQNTNQQQRTEFQQLTQALQSGNLTNARQLSAFWPTAPRVPACRAYS